MSALVTKTLLEQQVDLIKVLLGHRRGIDQHLMSCVMPHLGNSAREIVLDLVEILDREDAIDPNLACFLDAAIVEIRAAIAAGTRDEKVAIPRERLIGCTEAFETRKVPSPTAEALNAALPQLQALYSATRQAFDFAEAIRLSIRLLDQD